MKVISFVYSRIPLNARLVIFKSFIRSNFNYCPIVWHFCSKANTEKLERLQYRALRICFNDYTSSYESLLQKVKLPTLHLGRLRLIATETFKCLHKISPPYIQDLARFKSSYYSSKYDHMVEIPSVRTTTHGKNSFRFEAARVWNSLPPDIRKCDNYKDFQRLVRTWSGPGCKCSMCRT